MKSFVARFCQIFVLSLTTLLVVSVTFSVIAPAQAGVAPERHVRDQAQAGQAKLLASYGDLPLAFEPNQGQAQKDVRFAARAKSVTVLLSDREIALGILFHAPLAGRYDWRRT